MNIDDTWPRVTDVVNYALHAVEREGSEVPVKIELVDFEVHGTKPSTRTSTVLMIDMSRSMLLSGCFLAAKSVAIALDSLIRSQFPRGRVRTIEGTLSEVRRCTRARIVINAIVLDPGANPTRFVNEMTRINRGRAFFASPERLGDYVLVDCVSGSSNAS